MLAALPGSSFVIVDVDVDVGCRLLVDVDRAWSSSLTRERRVAETHDPKRD